MKVLSLAFLFFNVVLIQPAYSDSGPKENKSNIPNLIIGKTADVLKVRFEIPSQDIVSFTHKVQTESQKQELMNAKATLNTPFLVFALSPESCRATSKEVDVSAIFDEGKFEATEAKRKVVQVQPKALGLNYKIIANYRFECEQIKALNAISVVIFKQFKAIEEISVNWAIDDKSGSVVLTPTANTLSIY